MGLTTLLACLPLAASRLVMVHRLLFPIILTSLALSPLMLAPVHAQERHALVVGVDRYENIPSLQKAGNDARAVAAALEQAGFEVTSLIDSDRRDMSRAVSQFSASLSPGDEAVFYFAGHGVEVDGRNYLLPSDVPGMRPGEELFLISESLAADDVLSAIQSSGARVSVMILDACRDNPFPQIGTRSLGNSRGLARLEAPAGTFILFSAGIGQAALDRLSDEDPDPNSVFTRALLPLLSEPGVPIHEVARRLRREVQEMAETVGHVQRPAYYDEVTGNFVIQAAAAPPPEPEPQPAPDPAPRADDTAPVGRANPCDTALGLWQAIENAGSASLLNRFIETYGGACPVLSELASLRLAALRASAAPPAPVAAPEAAAPAANTPPERPVTAPRPSVATAPPLPEAEPGPVTPPAPVAETRAPCVVSGARVAGVLRGSMTPRRIATMLEDFSACGAFTAFVRSLQAELDAAPDARRMRDLRPIADAEEEEALQLSREDRIEVQRMLSNLGFEAGTPDGVFGPATRSALAGFLEMVGAAPAGSFTQNRTVPTSGYLSAHTLALLRQAQDIAPTSIDGPWVIEFNRIGDAAWLRANNPSIIDEALRDRPLEALEVTIENGEIVSHALVPSSTWNPVLPGTVHSIRLDDSGRLRASVTVHYLYGDRRENRRMNVDVVLRPGHLTTVARRDQIGRYDAAFFAVLHITRFLQEQEFEPAP